MAGEKADRRDFVMGFVAHSEKWRGQFVDKWQEVIANFIVEPAYSRQTTVTPYSRNSLYRQTRDQIILKDPETHKIVMTYAAKLARVLFGDARGEYVSAEPIGYEDVKKAEVTTRLLRYVFGRQGHFRSMIEGIVDMLTMGTCVIESPWKYEERETLSRSVESQYGVELDTFNRVDMPYYDDVCLRCIDVLDFYPDPSRYRIYEMAGVAKRFRMNAAEAKRTPALDQARVGEAISTASGSQERTESSFREGLDQPMPFSAKTEFKDMIGYEYWGETPWGRRVVTVLNNIVVRDEPYPYADMTLPFHTLIINPVQGRFYGVSPAEVIRHDQSFADAMKILLAEAMIRRVHPPIAYDSDSDIGATGEAKIRNWKADNVIAVRGGPSAIGTLKYDADLFGGFNMLTGLKLSMQEGSGAVGGIQGEEGPDRESARVGAARLQFAMDRPELAAMVLESECLPEIGRASLRRCQQFLDSEGLVMRVGEMPEPVWIGDIMGDFDVRFVGSRKAISRQEKLQSLDRLVALGTAIPQFRMVVPWTELANDVIGNWMQLPEVAVKIGSQETVMQNAALAKLAGLAGGEGGPAQNGVPQSSEPAGMLPAQAAGGVQ